jgi:hypothetical protein
MTILCCGDRNWKDKRKIKRTLKLFLWSAKTVVHGGANGADKLSGKAAKELGFVVRKHKAEWKKYGKAAGPIRNQKMLDEEDPNVVIAFHSNLKRSKGTKDMVARAKKADILVIRVE